MIYEVVLSQTYQGQNCVNRWNYVSSGTPAAVTGSFGLAFAFGAIPDVVTGYPSGTIISQLAALQASSVTFIDLIVKAVYDPTDFYAAPFVETLVGGLTGDGLPPFNAYGFRTNRVRRDIRRATKRFVGVIEANQANGAVSGATITALNDLGALMGQALGYNDEGNTLTYVPTVVSKQRYDPDTGNASAEGRAYRYYPDEATQLEHIAQGIVWDTYSTVRSQASRQGGHGT